MSQAPLTSLKTQIKTILDAANTATAAVNLSGGSSKVVAKVMKVNPLAFPIQASFYPLVSVYVDSKATRDDGIAKAQATARRKAKVTLNVVGAVWNANWANSDSVDEASDDCEHIMENIEEILRSNTQLASLCSWQMPSSVDYINAPMGGSAHIRTGVLKLEVTLWY